MRSNVLNLWLSMPRKKFNNKKWHHWKPYICNRLRTNIGRTRNKLANPNLEALLCAFTVKKKYNWKSDFHWKLDFELYQSDFNKCIFNLYRGERLKRLKIKTHLQVILQLQKILKNTMITLMQPNPPPPPILNHYFKYKINGFKLYLGRIDTSQHSWLSYIYGPSARYTVLVVSDSYSGFHNPHICFQLNKIKRKCWKHSNFQHTWEGSWNDRTCKIPSYKSIPK